MGQAAYELFKKTGRVPPGLDKAKPGAGNKGPSKQAKRAAAKPRLPRKDLPEIPSSLAKRLPPLSDTRFMKSMQSKTHSEEELTALAIAQARQALPDEAVVQHYKDTGVFKRRGLSHKAVRDIRDKWHDGEPIPLWAVPVGTDVAVYRDDDDPTPMVVGRVVGFQERHPLEESGKPMKVSVPYTIVQADGKFYEYPALLGGGPRSPHAVHPSFAAIKPLLRHLDYIPKTGWRFPNFYKGPDAGESDAPEDLERLATGMTRAYNFARNKGKRKD